MKKIIILFFLFLFFQKFCLAQNHSLSKKEVKELKAELKLFKNNLQGFKDFLTIIEDYKKNQIKQTELEKINAKNEVVYYQKLLKMFDDYAEIDERKQKNIDSLIKLKEYLIRKKTHQKRNLVFRIQIAALKNHPIDIFKKLYPHFIIELPKTKKDLKRYMIGNFISYHEALAFLDFLQKKEKNLQAVVVGFKNGKQIKRLAFFKD
jgi:hypothetical protein